ncbi:MAG: Na+/H+ antiporter subunit E [Proteobacteria bacterium]|nr:Na+/H+ antiporter subunit E [Pseudomonadota bacterium]
MKRTLILFANLMVVWLLLSGHYNATLITYGVLSCAGVVALMAYLKILDHEALPSHLGYRLFTYLPWLLKEVVMSNLAVAKVILSPSLPIHPRILRISASQKTQVGQVVYANSITLTPGTVTLDVRDGNFLVHALTTDSAAGLLSGEMDRRVSHLEENAAIHEGHSVARDSA